MTSILLQLAHAQVFIYKIFKPFLDSSDLTKRTGRLHAYPGDDQSLVAAARFDRNPLPKNS